MTVAGVLSRPMSTSTGSPQGCVLSPILYILYTNDCQADRDRDNTSIFKYADDTVIVGLITNNDERDYRTTLDNFVQWCDCNYLKLNETKTKEMVFDYRKSQSAETRPVTIHNSNIEIVSKYKYLGIMIDNKLNWEEQSRDVLAKGHMRLHYLRKLKSFRVERPILKLFYTAVVESTIMYGCLTWYCSLRKCDQIKIQRLLNQAGKIVGEKISLDEICSVRIIGKVENIMNDPQHPLHQSFCWMRSGKRLRSARCRTGRFLNSFIPFSIRAFNSSH